MERKMWVVVVNKKIADIPFDASVYPCASENAARDIFNQLVEDWKKAQCWDGWDKDDVIVNEWDNLTELLLEDESTLIKIEMKEMTVLGIESEENKLNPLDFALWKSAKPGEPFWDSPWGKGRPGWHIECSAMNMQAFGEQIDIHGGGRDLVFPHHENEIAQTESLTGKQFAKYWIHNGLIKVNGQKMSKSLGNSLLLADLLAKYSPETIKFALLGTNYRGDINITDTLFPDAEKHLYGFYKILLDAERAVAQFVADCPEIDREFDDAMDDDFNTAKALAALFGRFKEAAAMLRASDTAGAGKVLGQIKQTYSLLGLFKANPADFVADFDKKHASQIPEEVAALVRERADAKAAKDWAKADAIRAQITALGFSVKDTRDGAVVEKL